MAARSGKGKAPSTKDLIIELALALPEATTELTWGDVNLRVKGKIFCFPGEETMTVKADPEELEALLGDARVRPAAYVGRFGWVTLAFEPGRPVDATEIDELLRSSYAQIAPKRLARQVLPPR